MVAHLSFSVPPGPASHVPHPSPALVQAAEELIKMAKYNVDFDLDTKQVSVAEGVLAGVTAVSGPGPSRLLSASDLQGGNFQGGGMGVSAP